MKTEPPNSQLVIHLVKAENPPHPRSYVISACSKPLDPTKPVEALSGNMKECKPCQKKIPTLPRYLKVFRLPGLT